MTPDAPSPVIEVGAGRVARCLVHIPNDHLDRPFDYLVPDELVGTVRPGQVAEVVFAGRRVRAVVLEVASTSQVAVGKLRPLRRLLGEHVWLEPEDLEVTRWAAERFASSAGAVLSHVLPKRTIDVERRAAVAGWFPPGAGTRPPDPSPPDLAGWERYAATGDGLLSTLADGSGAWFWRPAPDEDVARRVAELAVGTLAAGRDVLLLVPDPVSAVADAVVAACPGAAVDLRGGPSARVVYRDWLRARCGDARVVIGERGSAFTPLANLGLAIAMDEANPAYKERRAPRHHAREVVLERARRSGAHAVLVGTVPSARSWALLSERRLTPVTATREDERRAAPRVELSDGSREPRGRIHRRAFSALREAVRDGRYAVVLTGRRGEGRALACRGCGERLSCPTCASTVDPADGGLVLCEGCGWRASRRPSCRACGRDEFVPLAAGAQLLAAELQRGLPGVPVAVLEGYAAPAPPPPAVLVMTRGSVLDHPPGPIGAIVLPDLDGMLRRPSLDAAEDALRLSMAVVRWAVAGEGQAVAGEGQAVAGEGQAVAGEGQAVAGEGQALAGRQADVPVIVQTREPEHHAMQALVRWDPGGFWRAEREHRAELRWPPVADALRLETVGDGLELLDELVRVVPAGDLVLGPVPRDGRAGFLVKSADRLATVAALEPLRRSWSQRGVDLRVDVDPVDVT